jgi:hypothetical protein
VFHKVVFAKNYAPKLEEELNFNHEIKALSKSFAPPAGQSRLSKWIAPELSHSVDAPDSKQKINWG